MSEIEIEIKIVDAQLAQLRALRSVPSAPVEQVEVVIRRERRLLKERTALESRLALAA